MGEDQTLALYEAARTARTAYAEALLWGELEKVVKAQKDDARQRAEDIMRISRAEKVRVRDDADLTDYGSVSLSADTTEANVYDADGLLAWVKRHRPDQVCEAVRPAFVTLLKKLAEEAPDGRPRYEGKVIPGVKALPKKGTLRVYPTAAARARMAAILAEGIQLTALPGAGKEGDHVND